MIPNNNLSVLPWYTSIEQQNARRWWVYGRVYPLFTPAGFILPFQAMREPLRMPVSYSKGEFIPSGDLLQNSFLNQTDEDQATVVTQAGLLNVLARFDVTGQPYVWWDNVPGAPEVPGYSTCNFAIFDADDNCLGAWTVPPTTAGGDAPTYAISVPQGASYAIVQFPAVGTAKLYGTNIEYAPAPITLFEIYKPDGTLVGDYTGQINTTIKTFDNYDVIVYQGLLPFTNSFQNGQYYAKMSDGTNTWYSEIFTVVNDIAPYLKLEWWDTEDLAMDAGTIVYANPSFKNVLYLDSDIAKPQYIFDEEGETRDGYFFPIKQISEKRYKFAFFASEYLLDVMRFIRMSDYASITFHGQTYSLDTFLITPEWEKNGDVASVEAEFDTATVAKKIGVGYIKAQRGDFNDDFNNDFNVN